MTSGFNWWMVPSVGTMCVDNVNAIDLDFSALPADVYMIQWREGRGEIELVGQPGLRSNFTDATPYVAFFQQFLTAVLPGLTLAQAQKVQTDLVALLYDSKRQAPFNFTVTQGNYNWSALDEDVAAMSLETVPYIAEAVAGTGGTTSSLVSQINAMIDQINSSIVSPHNTTVGQMNAYLIGSDINTSFEYVTIAGSASGNAPAAHPGLRGSVPAASNISHIAGPGGGSPITVSWRPIGATAPLSLSITDMSNLMIGIANRRTTLLTTNNTKTNAINALTAISDVIAYDVTAGW